MFRLVLLAALAASFFGGTAWAACPTIVPGTTSEAIRANEQRVLCLQHEINQSARQRQFEMELRANQNAINTLQMQRRFDNLPQVPPPSTFGQPPPFVPN